MPFHVSVLLTADRRRLLHEAREPHKKHRGKQLVRQGNIERDSNGAAADDEWLVNGLVSSRLKR